MKAKLKSKKTIMRIEIPVERNEPQTSIAMGYEGPRGKVGSTSFHTTIDMFGRGILIGYEKEDGTSGAFSVNVLDIIKASVGGIS
jgi:hypothetical protein